MSKVLVLLVVLYFTGVELSDLCSFNDLVKPCVCTEEIYGRNIRCEGNTALDLVRIFQGLDSHLNETQKGFSVFHLSNTAISELKENTFKDITFSEIFIGYCKSLTHIHENAFNGTDSVTKYLSFYNNSALSSPDNTIYKVARKFVKLQYFELENENVTEIPANAFGSLEHLLEVHFAGSSFKKLASKAFAKLPSLVSASFEQVNFDSITANAFEFENQFNSTFIIDFSDSPAITSSVFSLNSLSGMKRPAMIRFGSSKAPKQITYLNEKVFLPFLLENDKNGMDLNGEVFDCNDCRNYWLTKNPKAFNRIGYLKCSDRKPFIDPVHFKNCTS